ncbi:hypothetical protein BDN72DRAFT_375280 [Pluteus cervinus]|uniref:Uncharacterized protein n=1 Tax=Pluteus cervinus TaxID=181527 RepID=A0ACD3AAW6_9AGAR|nr:hypothetical protein BDN72DRAFT_375280 [Pluteus cervinus]
MRSSFLPREPPKPHHHTGRLRPCRVPSVMVAIPTQHLLLSVWAPSYLHLIQKGLDVRDEVLHITSTSNASPSRSSRSLLQRLFRTTSARAKSPSSPDQVQTKPPRPLVDNEVSIKGTSSDLNYVIPPISRVAEDDNISIFVESYEAATFKPTAISTRITSDVGLTGSAHAINPNSFPDVTYSSPVHPTCHACSQLLSPSSPLPLHQSRPFAFGNSTGNSSRNDTFREQMSGSFTGPVHIYNDAESSQGPSTGIWPQSSQYEAAAGISSNYDMDKENVLQSIRNNTKDIAHDILVTGVDMLDFVPILGVKGLVKTLLNIWSAFEKVQQNKEDCIDLIRLCSDVLYSMQGFTELGPDLVNRMSVSFDQLYEAFGYVETFVTSLQTQGSTAQYVKREHVARMLKRCERKLGHAMAKFQMSMTAYLISNTQNNARTLSLILATLRTLCENMSKHDNCCSNDT